MNRQRKKRRKNEWELDGQVYAVGGSCEKIVKKKGNDRGWKRSSLERKKKRKRETISHKSKIK